MKTLTGYGIKQESKKGKLYYRNFFDESWQIVEKFDMDCIAPWHIVENESKQWSDCEIVEFDIIVREV